jgi:hypothetical protein
MIDHNNKKEWKELPNFKKIMLTKNGERLNYTIERIEKPVDGGVWYLHCNNAGLSFEYKLKNTLKILNEMTQKQGYSVLEVQKN